MQPIRCLLVDDERLARELLREQLAEYPAFTVVAEAPDIIQALGAVRLHSPDLIFLDIQMPGGDGFELLRQLMPNPPHVVFETAHDRYALRAFEVNALDYLLKPLMPRRFREAISKVERRIRLETAAEPHCPDLPPLRAADLIHVPAGHSGCFIRMQDILYITSQGNYTAVVTSDQQQFLLRQTLADWLKRLPKEGFLQVDRTCIIHLRRIARAQLSAHAALVRFGDSSAVLELGRSAAERLKRAMASG